MQKILVFKLLLLSSCSKLSEEEGGMNDEWKWDVVEEEISEKGYLIIDGLITSGKRR